MSFIETERLYLRTWMPGDADEAFAMYGDAEVMRYVRGGQRTREVIPALLDRMTAMSEGTLLGLWPVIEKDGGAIVGICGLHPGGNEAGAEIGWILRRSAWGKGYATEAALAVLGYAREHKIDPVYAYVLPRNSRSIAVFPRLGMVFDRIVRRERADMMRYTTV